MEKLVIPKDCILRGERITIRYEGDILIENDLVPLSVKSDAGSIGFFPQDARATCSHLSAENGCLEVRAQALSAEFLSGMTGKLSIGELEISQALQFSQDLTIEGTSIEAPEVHAGVLKLVLDGRGQIQNLEVDGAADVTLGQGQIGTIKAKSLRLAAKGPVECERISAEESVYVSSGSISVKMIDAPRFEAEPGVKGVVILATCDDVRAEGVRGFIKPEEFKMFSQQDPLVLEGGATQGSRRVELTDPEDASPATAEERPPEEVVTRPVEVVSESLESQSAAEPLDEPAVPELESVSPEEEPEIDEGIADADDDEQGPPGAEIQAEQTEELMAHADEEFEPIDARDMESQQRKARDHLFFDDEEMPDTSPDDDEYLTREISTIQPEHLPSTPPALEAEQEAESADEAGDVNVPAEAMEDLPEITDFGDFPELTEENQEGEEEDVIEDMEFEILDAAEDADFSEFQEIPDDDEADFDDLVGEEGGPEESFKSEPLPDDPEIEDTTDLESAISDSAAEVFGPGGLATGHIDELQRPDLDGYEMAEPEIQANAQSKEDRFVEDLRAVLSEIQACFPDDNYPKFIGQIETYLDERRFSILRKQRNKEAVLSSFDRLDHPRISQLAREFYAKMADYFEEEA